MKTKKMLYLPDDVSYKLAVLSAISKRSQSELVESALRDYLGDMQNALSEDDKIAEMLDTILARGK